MNISTKNHGNPIAFAVKNDYLVIIQELVTHSPGQLNTRVNTMLDSICPTVYSKS